MAAQKEKTISYRRAVWFEGSGTTLERCVRDAHSQLKLIDERTVGDGGRLIRSAKQKENQPDGGVLLHLTAENPGASTSIVPHVPKTARSLDLKTEQPPAYGEWLDGDAFILVKDDHVCICTTDIRDRAVEYFFKELFRKAKIRQDATRFQLYKIADISKIKLLHSQGVREVEIYGVLYKATADYTQRKNQAFGSLGAIGKFFKTLMDKPYDVTPDSLTACVTLKVDRRFSKTVSVGYKNIEMIAANLVENQNEEDEYAIVTKLGQRITNNEIFVKTKVSIDREGNTIQRDKAWREVSAFFASLNKSGVLDE